MSSQLGNKSQQNDLDSIQNQSGTDMSGNISSGVSGGGSGLSNMDQTLGGSGQRSQQTGGVLGDTAVGSGGGLDKDIGGSNLGVSGGGVGSIQNKDVVGGGVGSGLSGQGTTQ
jgi:hypothetical protein